MSGRAMPRATTAAKTTIAARVTATAVAIPVITVIRTAVVIRAAKMMVAVDVIVAGTAAGTDVAVITAAGATRLTTAMETAGAIQAVRMIMLAGAIRAVRVMLDTIATLAAIQTATPSLAWRGRTRQAAHVTNAPQESGRQPMLRPARIAEQANTRRLRAALAPTSAPIAKRANTRRLLRLTRRRPARIAPQANTQIYWA